MIVEEVLSEYMPNESESNDHYSVIGTRPLRPDGVDKVTGRAQYGADIHMPRLAYGKVLRSPHAHANIRAIDTTKAESLSGVIAVVTSKDLPNVSLSNELKYMRDNVLASDKVLYKGHPVAGVAANNQHIAEQALDLIEVQYEIIEPSLTAQDAIRTNAPILLDDLRTKEFGQEADTVSNVANHYQHSIGDIQDAFSKADVTVEGEFNTKTVHQGYLEPHNTTALWNKDGRITIWRSTQGQFEVRDATARILDIDVSRVKVVPMEIGGGFGGKFDPYNDPVAAMLSR